jgi:hypothetical protein
MIETSNPGNETASTLKDAISQVMSSIIHYQLMKKNNTIISTWTTQSCSMLIPGILAYQNKKDHMISLIPVFPVQQKNNTTLKHLIR